VILVPLPVVFAAALGTALFFLGWFDWAVAKGVVLGAGDAARFWSGRRVGGNVE